MNGVVDVKSDLDRDIPHLIWSLLLSRPRPLYQRERTARPCPRSSLRRLSAGASSPPQRKTPLPFPSASSGEKNCFLLGKLLDVGGEGERQSELPWEKSSFEGKYVMGKRL